MPNRGPGGSLAACIATVLDRTHARGIPETIDGLRPWLAVIGLGLAPVAEPATFSWPGPWLAWRIAPDGEEGAVLMYGVPSGPAFDPLELGPDAVTVAAWVVATHDPMQHARRRQDADPRVGRLEAIVVAEAAGAPVRLVDEAVARPGTGLDGDRYASGRGTFPSRGDGTALTLMAQSVIDSFDPPLAPAEHRRNLVVSGTDPNTWTGRDFLVGDVRCAGRRPAQPCAHLQRLVDREVLRPLARRGGLRADVLETGTIRVGDVVRLADPPRGSA